MAIKNAGACPALGFQNKRKTNRRAPAEDVDGAGWL